MTSRDEVKVAIVTGSASGIGLAVTRELAAQDYRVFAIDKVDGFREPLSAEEQSRITPIAADLTDAEAIDAAFARITAETGAVSLLVNNAGTADICLIEDLTLQDWSRVFAVNLTAALLCLQKSLPLLRAAGRGSVVNVSSLAGKRMSYNGGVAYTASKSGLLGLTRHAAFEFARDNIRVNAICPGPVLTPMILENTTQTERDGAQVKMPLGEWVMPEDIAHAVMFLAGPASAKMTGTTLDVDSGFLVSNGTAYAEYFKHRKGASGGR
ncbi:SDR family NAD(P)-dependent oxidoreductase [Thalassococcus sp. S3]|uniref:SDR family NAD(P)-dependent oxidoreductase n=1 Tax=Thalassococcus sp. S3 TaxID=2017482 RepID=UPI0010245854|nr:SDR family oxidoreductase [Thalassococcus sp. S3]QBF32582.1 hypothetical protein CFI11_15350 [Thalassococcus sp. S3]